MKMEMEKLFFKFHPRVFCFLSKCQKNKNKHLLSNKINFKQIK